MQENEIPRPPVVWFPTPYKSLKSLNWLVTQSEVPYFSGLFTHSRRSERNQIALEYFNTGKELLIHLRKHSSGNYFFMFFWFRSHEKNWPSLRSACSRDAPIYNISRTEITHWTASPFEDYSTFVKTGTYKNNLVSFLLQLSLNWRVKLAWLALVDWPLAAVWGKITLK